METKLFQHKGIVLSAKFIGLFKRKEPKGRCTHVYCGFIDKNAVDGVRVTCQFLKFIAYKPKELAAPGTTPEAAGIQVDLYCNCNHELHRGIACLYDLINDKWANDAWWQTCNDHTTLYPRGDDAGADCMKPSEIANVSEIISSLKEKL